MSEAVAILDGVDGDLVPDSSRLAGIVTVAELLAAGLSRPQVRRLARQRVLLPLGWGIYARAALVAGAARGPAGEEAVQGAAGLAIVGRDAVGRHRGAAVIHGIELFGRQQRRTVTVPRRLGGGGSNTARPGIRLHTAALPAGQTTVRRGVPVTSVAR